MARASHSSYAGSGSYMFAAQIALGASVAMLLALGLVMVYSADSIEAIGDGANPTSSLFKQLLFVVVGVVAILVTRIVGGVVRYAPAIIALNAVSDLLLILTQFMGTEALGAKRWIYLLGDTFSFQPSELSKIVILITTAYLVCCYKNGAYPLKKLLILFGLGALLPLAFIVGPQSDLGSTLICLVGIIAILWFAGLSGKVLLGMIGAVLLVAVLFTVATPYRMARIISLLSGNTDTEGAGLQATHALYAIAQGGFFGVGIGNSAEKYQYLPEAETDFIFAVICEELGMAGALLVMILFLIILASSIYIALNASDEFGQLLTAGLAIMLVFQAYFNIALVMGVAPLTGKPLPFLSKGGTSLLMNCIIIGLILSVARSSDPDRISKKRRDALQVVSGGNPANYSASLSARSQGTRSSAVRGSTRPVRQQGEIYATSSRSRRR